MNDLFKEHGYSSLDKQEITYKIDDVETEFCNIGEADKDVSPLILFKDLNIVPMSIRKLGYTVSAVILIVHKTAFCL